MFSSLRVTSLVFFGYAGHESFLKSYEKYLRLFGSYANFG